MALLTTRERLVCAALAVLLLLDLRAVTSLREGSRCASTAPLRSVAGLDAAITLAGVLRPGRDLRGTAVVSNTGPTRLRVLHVGAVLVAPATSVPLTWTGDGDDQQVTLAPGSVTRVTFVVHTARCRGGAPLRAGWYELTLALATDAGELRAGVRATVLS